jgi:glycosyltransferase involved in cell wall biosynthesis
MTQEKIKVMVIADHPLSPSGVGTQTKYMIQAMLATGKYRFVCLGGAMKHPDYNPIQVTPWNEDWLIFPVDGYGSQDMVRSFLNHHKPDILWFMTDPRFYGWLWEMENEIRSVCPMIYYHVWDNYPYPKFNKRWYDSNDVVVSISKVTSDIVRTVAPEVEEHYLPHAVDMDTFKKHDAAEVLSFKKQSFQHLGADSNDDRMVFFWNNRNARRKMSGTVIWWFKEFLDTVGHDKARLLMHTDPKDPHGQDLPHIMDALGLRNGEVLLSTEKVSQENLALIYNMVDCTVNIADAEGFGLSTFESLACSTPIIVNMTGGLQEQVTNGEDWFGIGIEPAAKAIIGSQEVPYIHEDRVSKESFIQALTTMYNLSKEEREELGTKGRKHLEDNYSYKQFSDKWDKILTSVHERFGSWDNRQGYKSWKFEEV